MYYDSTVLRLTPEFLDTRLFTHGHYSFAILEPDTLQLVPQTGSSEYPLMQRFITAVTSRNPCARPIVTVGGWNWAHDTSQPGGVSGLWRQAASTPANRARFAENIITFCRQWGFAGVDLVRYCRRAVPV